MLSHDNKPENEAFSILVLYSVPALYLDDRSVGQESSDADTMYVFYKTKIVQGTKIVQTVIFILIISTLVVLLLSPETHPPYYSLNPLDGCVYVYLDMGTNIGVQIRNGNAFTNISFFIIFFSRKLFEAQKFPGSNVTQIFRNFFFKNPDEFRNIKEFKEQARKHTR